MAVLTALAVGILPFDRREFSEGCSRPCGGYRLASMADQRRFELDDLLLRPGCYLNPQTEVMVVVDDSPAIDGEIFNMEEFEGADWVLIADEVPVDEARRDELLETFQATYHGGDGRTREVTASEDDDFVDDEENRPPEPDAEEEEL
jgi:hypothetical protein